MTNAFTPSKPTAESQRSAVAAVVVTYNRKALLARCLDALLGQTYPLAAIYVVDNASTDGTREMISERYQGRVTYEALPGNMGGAGGFHHGMRLASDSEVDWIWVMDDDVRPDDCALEELLRAATSDRVVLVPVRIDDSSGALAEAACVRYDLHTAVCLPGRHMTSVMALFPSVDALPELLELANFSFEGPLISRRAVRQAGLPVSQYFIYGDDTEYALRLRKFGVTAMLVRDARLRRMLNTGARSADNAWKTRYIIRNNFWNNRLHGCNAGSRYLRNYVWAGAVILSNVVKLEFVRHPKRFAACIRGVCEGLWRQLPRAQGCHGTVWPLKAPPFWEATRPIACSQAAGAETEAQS